ncbi:MAG TPA: hypothetical protein V6D18_04410 [Thermosynechococcaceae cyanobacterium]
MGWISKAICLSLMGLVGSLGMPQTEQATSTIAASSTFQPLLPQQPSPQQPSTFPSLKSQQFDQQLQRYLRFLSESGTPDILIVGSSRAAWGIDPIVLQKTLAERGYGDLKIFNFGVNGATAQVVDWLLRNLLTPEQLPRLILWGDGARAFNSGRVDATYANLTTSEGFRSIATGTRPQPPLPLKFRLGLFCLEMPPSYSASLSSIPFTPNQTDRRSCSTRLRLFRRLGLTAQMTPRTIAALHETTGFLAKSEKFDPDTYFQRYPEVPGDYDTDYRNFSLSGAQTIALENVLGYATLHKVPIVFVSLPLTQIYLDPVRSDSEDQFRAFLQQFAAAKRLTVYDLSQRWLDRYDYFVDPSHLNQFGAEAVAREIGKALVLPKSPPSKPPP